LQGTTYEFRSLLFFSSVEAKLASGKIELETLMFTRIVRIIYKWW